MISSSASNGNKLSSKRMMDGRQSPAYKIIMWSIMVLTSQHQLKSIHHCTAFSTFASFNGPSASSRLHISLQNQQRVAFYRFSGLMTSSNSNEQQEYVRADDVESIHELFRLECDAEGLMTKNDVVRAIPDVSDWLRDGDLLQTELDDIWSSAPKFLGETPDDEEEKIDVDSFTQIYRDIDGLFEDDDEENLEESEEVNDLKSTSKMPKFSSSNNNNGLVATMPNAVSDDENELKSVFDRICDSSGLISRENLYNWDEVQVLVDDSLLKKDEFDSIFDKTRKSPGTDNMLDIEGFLSFNLYLDDLFEIGENEETEIEMEVNAESKVKPLQKRIVKEEDLPPGVLFAELAGGELFIGWDDLKRWGELRDMISEGDLLASELKKFFASIPKAGDSQDMLDEEGFCELHEIIFNLFEDDDDDETNSAENGEAVSAPEPKYKDDLIKIIENVEKRGGLCGLDTLDREEAQVLDVIKKVEDSQPNLIKQRDIEKSDLAGSWDLLYTSSGMFKFNRGLTGLAGSVPNAEFGGLTQVIKVDDYYSDLNYVEKVVVKGSEENSFDAKVNADWELKKSVSLFTGEPTVVMSVEPDKVEYGLSSTRADHWKSVRSMNLLDVSYLDNDLRIMRGNTSTDTIFVFKRSKR